MESCYRKSSNNPDRFAACLSDTRKKVEEINDQFSLKLLFISRDAQECLANGRSVEDCTSKAIDLAGDVIKNAQKTVDKI